MRVDPEDWKNAGISAGNLTHLQQLLSPPIEQTPVFQGFGPGEF
jgi:hypothetical protein